MSVFLFHQRRGTELQDPFLGLVQTSVSQNTYLLYDYLSSMWVITRRKEMRKIDCLYFQIELLWKHMHKVSLKQQKVLYVYCKMTLIKAVCYWYK